MKNREIIAYLNGLIEVTNNQDDAIKKDPSIRRFPAKVSFAINRNKKVLIEEYKTYLETLQGLNEQYNLNMTKEGKVELSSLPVKDKDKYIAELNSLQDVNVEVDIHKINEAAFGDYEPTLKELELLDFMFK